MNDSFSPAADCSRRLQPASERNLKVAATDETLSPGGMASELDQTNSGQPAFPPECSEKSERDDLSPHATPPGDSISCDGATDCSRRLQPASAQAKACDYNLPSDVRDSDLAEAYRRQRLLVSVSDLIAQHGLTRAAACARAGIKGTTHWRWETAFAADGLAGLLPQRGNSGSKCEWAASLLDEQFRAKLLKIYLATIGASSAAAANDRRTAKIATALEHFAYEPECPAELARKLKRGYQPKPFCDYLRKSVTPEIEAKVRGPKHSQLYGSVSRRDWTGRLPDGRRFDYPAAYTLSADDMSENHPYWVTGPDGPILSRQGLYFFWGKHKIWQSVELIARVRESYRAEDVLRAFFRTCQSAGGVPHRVEFERGVWQAKLISGWRYDAGWLVEETVERPGMAEADWKETQLGLELCGVHIDYKHNPHHKHIETNFNPFQTGMAVTARDFQCIGRYAGEFERPGKQLRRVRAGSFLPADLGFASQRQLADCIAEAFSRLNAKLTPEGITRLEAHQRDLAQVPLLPITDRLFAACLPGRPRPITLRGGVATVWLNKQPIDFRDELFARLGDGYQVGIKFDETDPNLGAAVFNLTAPSNSANFEGWPINEYIGCAAREIPGPKHDLVSAPPGVTLRTVEESYGRGAIDQGDTLRKKSDKFAATEFRAIRANGLPGQPGIRSATARDGRGNVAESGQEGTVAANVAAGFSLRPPQPKRGALAPPTAEQLQRRRSRLAEQAEDANRLRELQET